MELVRGLPITDFCRVAALPIRHRLRLFRDVCSAVQHAHQKGIIHRDLKPSNILITAQSGEPVAKVIDFGIAKALEADVQRPAITRAGQLIGTLEYMSPEQAGGTKDDVDTRSDVYSLGVVLYEVISAQLPYAIAGKALVEAARVIAEETPHPLRSIDSGRRVDSDLTTIVLKALAKNPAERYASVAALADDIDRYLEGQPILAHPPSAIYQIRKLVARNKLPVALAASLFATLVVFGVTMSVLFQSQRAARARAVAEANKASAVNTFLREMFTSINSEGRAVTVREVLDVASREIDTRFADQPEVKAALHSTIGSAFTALHEMDDAGRHINASLEIRRQLVGDDHPDVATSLSELPDFEVAKGWDIPTGARADSLAERAYAIRRATLGDEHPDVTASIIQLAGLHEKASRHAKADSLYSEALARIRHRVGDDDPGVASLLQARASVLVNLARPAEADSSLRTALAIFGHAYPGDHEAKSTCLRELGFLTQSAAEKESLLIEHVAMERRLWGDDHPNLIKSLSTLAEMYLIRFEFDKGERLCREALAISEKNYPADHVAVGEACNDLGCQLQGKREDDAAAALFRRALDIFEKRLGPEHVYCTICRTNLTSVLDALGRDDEAWSLLQEGLAVTERSAGKDSGDAALNHRRMAEFLNNRQRWDEGAEHARKAYAYFHGDPYQRPNWSGCAHELARALHGQSRLTDAERCFAEADSVLREHGKVPALAIENLLEWGECLLALRRSEEAARRLEEAHARCIEEFGTTFADYPAYAVALAESEADRGLRNAAVQHAEIARDLAAAQVRSDEASRSSGWRDRKGHRMNLDRANRLLARETAASLRGPG
jgi:tetratricopeptide (TPR) repeat protein